MRTKKTERHAPTEPPEPNHPRPLRQVSAGGVGDGWSHGSVARLRSSPYFRMRSALRELRPMFVQVLQTPDMRHSQPAQEIREKLKLLMDLYKQMTADTATAEWYGNISFGQHSPRQFPRPLSSGMGQPPPYPGNATAGMRQYKQPDLVKIHGTYVVGSSTSGWNFITYLGNKPVYYGRTKKSFRAAQSKLLKTKKSSLPKAKKSSFPLH
ncbi:hypothetical protein MLD38_018283 [Melastoma candidum]|uniref:Uncharacterized protein n=1 Tax=Melastoma candidum TaxID=119954 RepID=A0ACB9QUN5_9MYRT|nr:hypothetical protein MLD38_018283 [Melastoma candidum]